MRISDWSSDVCSSDLDARRTRRLDGFVIGLADGEVVADDAAERRQRQDHRVERPVGLVEDVELQAGLGDRKAQVGGTAVGAERPEEVGRAAGRGRVGQYGKNSVETVKIQQKKNKNKNQIRPK